MKWHYCYINMMNMVWPQKTRCSFFDGCAIFIILMLPSDLSLTVHKQLASIKAFTHRIPNNTIIAKISCSPRALVSVGATCRLHSLRLKEA